MAALEGFPRELLGQPIDARLAYFVGKVVAHPRLKEAHQALLSAIRQPAGASLILVFGPTGVGKTTLRLRVEKQLIEEALPTLREDPGRVPVVGLEAVAPDSGRFNWKDYYNRALMALEEPLIEQKIGYDMRSVRPSGAEQLGIRRADTPELRRALEQCLRQRRPTAFIVDEAQHLKKMASGRRLLDQMDNLKSLAALTGTVHVLVGTYELLGLANLSAQLSRRSVDIHFGRYLAEYAEDLLAFKSVLLTFQRHLPLIAEPNLVARWEYLYERSVGCVGVLKNWLSRALAAALEEGEATLTDRHLERHAEPTRKLLALAREIKEGEEVLSDVGRDPVELRALLGMPPLPARGDEGDRRPGAAGPIPLARRQISSVGQRRPMRDPVGEGR
ncbi:MAG: ATP-binding protein [Chloroflexi bacterium]|nr:ATP-binding protein [Chloroflexota bacterium]